MTDHIPSKTVDNPWREFIENVISGKNYFRVSEYHELLTDLDRLYALEEKHATQTAVVHMGIDDQPHDGRRIDCVKCHSDETNADPFATVRQGLKAILLNPTDPPTIEDRSLASQMWHMLPTEKARVVHIDRSGIWDEKDIGDEKDIDPLEPSEKASGDQL